MILIHSCLDPSSILLTKNLSTPLLIWSIFPINPYLPVLVTEVIVEPVPAYYLLIISPFFAHIFFMTSKMNPSLFILSNPYTFVSTYEPPIFLFSSLILSRIVSKILFAIIVWVTFVLSKQSRQFVRTIPFYSSRTFPLPLSSTKNLNRFTSISSIFDIRSWSL